MLRLQAGRRMAEEMVRETLRPRGCLKVLLSSVSSSSFPPPHFPHFSLAAPSHFIGRCRLCPRESHDACCLPSGAPRILLLLLPPVRSLLAPLLAAFCAAFSSTILVLRILFSLRFSPSSPSLISSFPSLNPSPHEHGCPRQQASEVTTLLVCQLGQRRRKKNLVEAEEDASLSRSCGASRGGGEEEEEPLDLVLPSREISLRTFLCD
eukprot:764830-Hanusia_phi.AAC.1